MALPFSDNKFSWEIYAHQSLHLDFFMLSDSFMSWIWHFSCTEWLLSLLKREKKNSLTFSMIHSLWVCWMTSFSEYKWISKIKSSSFIIWIRVVVVAVVVGYSSSSNTLFFINQTKIEHQSMTCTFIRFICTLCTNSFSKINFKARLAVFCIYVCTFARRIHLNFTLWSVLLAK